MLLLSPLLGSFVATCIMFFYIAINNSIINIFSIIESFPLIFSIFSVVSYFFSLTIGKILIKKKNCWIWSNGYFMFISFICGAILGVAFSLINFYIEKNIIKALLIFSCFALGGLFNASFYVSLKKEFNINE